MGAITLGYHDVVERENRVYGAFRSAPKQYSVTKDAFRSHLEEIQRALKGRKVKTFSRTDDAAALPVYLTFDDGAECSYSCTADELERLGWRGHFFVVSKWVGKTGFLDSWQIRELHERGHVIGSHSHTHPSRMSSLDRPRLWREWTRSQRILSDIIGAPVRTASIPNGYYSLPVARAAAQAGFETLFTSEPTTETWEVGGCTLLGRYAINASTTPRTVGQIAAGERLPRVQQMVSWQFKKAAKKLGGRAYLKLRGAVLKKLRA